VLDAGIGAMADTADTIGRGHPIGSAAAQIEDVLKTVRDAPAWSMNPGETREELARLTRLEAQLVELQARVVAHGETIEVEAESGATSTANWWAQATKQTRPGAHRKTRLATALASQAHEPVRVALADGRLLVDQAEVIIAAVDALPADLVDQETRLRAQETLIAYAAEHDAKALRILGKRILDVVAPEVGEAHEARLLEAEEREAEAGVVFRMHDDGHGRSHGKFTIPTAYAEMLRKALLAIAAPKHRASVDGQAPSRGGRPRTRWGWRSVSTSPATPPTTSRTPAESQRPWWSPWTWTPCSAGSRPPSWTPATGSAPPWPGGGRARRGSSPPSSAGSPRSSTWAGSGGSTPRPSGSPWLWSRAGAPRRAATGHPACATPTTTNPGAPAAPRT
jgi:hypothetical protein